MSTKHCTTLPQNSHKINTFFKFYFEQILIIALSASLLRRKSIDLRGTFYFLSQQKAWIRKSQIKQITNPPHRYCSAMRPPRGPRPGSEPGTLTAQSRQSAKLFSSRRNWDSPNPLPAGECAPPPLVPGGEAYSQAREGVEESQFRRRGHKLWYSVYICCEERM
jgi:hypothetical protein